MERLGEINGLDIKEKRNSIPFIVLGKARRLDSKRDILGRGKSIRRLQLVLTLTALGVGIVVMVVCLLFKTVRIDIFVHDGIITTVLTGIRSSLQLRQREAISRV